MQRYLNVKQVAERYGVDPSTVWRWRREKPDFPEPHKFGPQTLRWSLAALDEWDAAQIGGAA